jgi:hypothetical protein
MNEKFDPAPFDKYAADPKKAIEIDRVVDQQPQAGIVGGSFPASDPITATQPSPSIYDERNEHAGPADDAQLSKVVGDVLHILHGARGLPSSEAVEALRPFLNTMRSRASGIDVLADASADAVGKLVRRLEATGIATDDLWEEAIEASLSFANETGFGARSALEG